MTPSSHDSDADVTSQYPSLADETNVDLAPAGADATTEIEAIDIISVKTVKSDDSASDVLRTTQHERIVTPSTPVRLLTPRRPSEAILPPSTTMLTKTAIYHPSSIAPMALDVMAPRVSADSLSQWSPLPTVSTTLELGGTAGIPRTSPRVVMFATFVAGACLVAGAVGAVLGYDRDEPQPVAVATTGTAFHAPRAGTVVEAREEVTISPPSATEKAAAAAAAPPPVVEADELTDSPAPVPTTAMAPVVPAAPPTMHISSLPSAPAPAPASIAVAAPPRPVAVAAPAGHGTTGILHVPGAPPGALIDGAPHRVENGQIVVACGHHKVKIPGHDVRNVTVPCGGNATF